MGYAWLLPGAVDAVRGHKENVYGGSGTLPDPSREL